MYKNYFKWYDDSALEKYFRTGISQKFDSFQYNRKN